MTLREKLDRLDFLTNLATQIREIDLRQIETFVSGKLLHLFLKMSANAIQDTVDRDVYPVIVNYLTHIIEVGSIKSVAVNRQEMKSRRDLSDYVYIMVWAYNICIADGLIRHGMKNIPAVKDGLINIYYSDNALLMIADRIEQHISLGNSAGNGLLNAFADGMIQEHLSL